MARLNEILKGAKFGRLTATGIITREFNTVSERYLKYAEMICDCGKTISTRVDNLGVRVFSCGCLNLENTAAKGRANRKHGLTGTGTYKSWSNMWDRCTRESHPKYHMYKDRTPPEEWRDFEVFLADMGERPEGYSIERVDNDKPYSKENCIWLPMSEQYRNTSRNHILIKNGVEYLLSEACEEVGVNRKTVVTRIWALGWTLQKALGHEWQWKDVERGKSLEAAVAEAMERSRVRPKSTQL